MVFIIISKITFPKTEHRNAIEIRKPNAISINKGWKMLTDTAEIKLPRNVNYFNKFDVNKVFRVGDPVIIELGYHPTLVREFEGYITSVSADTPIIIKCEDEMYKLKKLPVNIVTKTMKLEKLLQKIAPKYQIDALDVEIAPQRFPRTTVAKVLEFLKQEYSLYSYMKGGTLVCGKIYTDDSDIDVVDIDLEKTVVANQLVYKNNEDISIQIIAVSTLRNGGKIEVKVGDEDGEQRELPYYGITSKEALKKIALEDLKKFKIDGWSGSLTTYGLILTNNGFVSFDHGAKLRLLSRQYPDRNGINYVESVKIDLSDAPSLRRTAQLGDKASA
ncbi:hypothetical protein EZY14_009335 [Kordia sp. TARA_039_SRF]|nr:hypothetical protein EZY14_009335 [Kordia sp. TARA_039_SRF]